MIEDLVGSVQVYEQDVIPLLQTSFKTTEEFRAEVEGLVQGMKVATSLAHEAENRHQGKEEVNTGGSTDVESKNASRAFWSSIE